ncbi:hypothetical protein JXVLWARM_CDS_0103 [Burkholderia phage Bm1]
MTTCSLAASLATLIADADSEVLAGAMQQLAPEIVRKLTGAMEYGDVFKEIIRRQARTILSDAEESGETNVTPRAAIDEVSESANDTVASWAEDLSHLWGEVRAEPEFKE